MRRWLILLSILLSLSVSVSAFSGISSVHSTTKVDSTGSCQVTLTLELTPEISGGELYYPLPDGAYDVSLNGAPVSVSKINDRRQVELTDVITSSGSCTLTIQYWLEDAVLREDDQLILTLELLSGFAYPIDSLTFTIELPGAAEAYPSFTSTYYQTSIEALMTVTREDALIRGEMHQRLQDHETLTMTLPVTAEMFPQPVAKRWSMDTVDLVMLSTAGLALIYWLIWLRCPPMRRLRRTTAPDGITAGEIPCRLTGQGADLTMMVLSWAQMGYILIQPDDDGRVLLHKRMTMGNERDDFELRWFHRLFGKRHIVDGTGYYYAKLCYKAKKQRPGLHGMFHRHTGNPTVFRFLCAAIGTVSGVSLAAAFAGDEGWRTTLSILLGVCGFSAAWLMQNMGKALHSRHPLQILPGLAAAAVWLLLSIPAGEFGIALALIPIEILAGLAALYGGRRTETGRSNAGEILGLREYLRSMDAQELQRNLDINPQYYYDMAPYALAMGIDRSFARKLGKNRLPECPYLTTGMDGHLTAQEWNQLLRDTVRSLDALQARMPLDRLLGR